MADETHVHNFEFTYTHVSKDRCLKLCKYYDGKEINRQIDRRFVKTIRGLLAAYGEEFEAISWLRFG